MKQIALGIALALCWLALFAVPLLAAGAALAFLVGPFVAFRLAARWLNVRMGRLWGEW